MTDGIITDLVYRNGIAGLKIRTGNKELKYRAPMSLQQYRRLNKKQKCRYQAKNDLLMKLVIDGEDILTEGPIGSFPKADTRKPGKKSVPTRQQAQTRPREGVGQPQMQPGETRATAPYNFVPVNKIVVKSEAPPSFDSYHQGLYTGYINLDIETLTPLYIRGSNAEDGGEVADFFSPGSKPKIPGSSLRGMTRNLVEIVSCSRMEYVDDSTLYYRSLADQCRSVRIEYSQIMGQRGPNANRPGYRFKAGYLQRVGQEYQILPARIQNGRQYLRTPKLNTPEFSWQWQQDGSCITVSGPDPSGKKTKDWLINPVDNNARPIKISAPDLNAYRNDSNRFKDKRDITDSEKRDGDLLRCLRAEESLENAKNMVPCFYVTWTEHGGIERVAFGHTAYFRLAYRLSIKQHLPIAHRSNDNPLDLTSAIFGQASNFAGRVFFEDALIDSEDLVKVSQEEVYLKILSNPKPTTFQHYLEQGNKNKNNLLHWNNQEALLRGHKMYWHRQTPQTGENGWEAGPEDVQSSPSQYTRVKTITSDAHFQGRIRFENLSAIELGALLFVLELPNGCAHKIGMGKPLGLGSVRIKPTLTLSKRMEAEGRYGRLFDGQKWYLAEEPAQIDDFKAGFAEHMLKETKHEKGASNPFNAYWNTERMRELRAILSFDQNTGADDWLERTRYMEIERRKTDSSGREKKENEFSERPVLSSPLETIKAAGIKYEQ
jgi:CRISPR/Cas system CSM-associated protein Csm3 (group 7 of RAMP superfamily)